MAAVILILGTRDHLHWIHRGGSFTIRVLGPIPELLSENLGAQSGDLHLINSQDIYVTNRVCKP